MNKPGIWYLVLGISDKWKKIELAKEYKELHIRKNKAFDIAVWNYESWYGFISENRPKGQIRLCSY